MADQNTNVIDISKFFGGKTLSSADVRVNTSTVLKTEPSFIAAPELARLLDVIATSTEESKTQVEQIKSIERVREREIITREQSDSRFQQALKSMMDDVTGLKNVYKSLLNTLQSDRKLKEEELRDREDKQKILKSEQSEVEKGMIYQSSMAKATKSFTTEYDLSGAQSQQQQDEESDKGSGFATAIAAAGTAGLIGGMVSSESGGGPIAPSKDLRSGARSFVSAGFPEKGAAYLSGNVQQESGWSGQRKPWVLNDGAGTNKGLMSWNRGRVTNAEKFLGKPLNEASNEEQIRWIKYEMQTYYPEAYKIFMNPNSTDAQLQRASYIYLGYGEVGARFKYAQEALKSLQTSKSEPDQKAKTSASATGQQTSAAPGTSATGQQTSAAPGTSAAGQQMASAAPGTSAAGQQMASAVEPSMEGQQIAMGATDEPTRELTPNLTEPLVESTQSDRKVTPDKIIPSDAGMMQNNVQIAVIPATTPQTTPQPSAPAPSQGITLFSPVNSENLFMLSTARELNIA